MNFYGHAVLAAEQSRKPRFVLGAMLPDLVGMAGLRLPPLLDPELQSGVDHHHLIDGLFHRAPPFIELVTRTFSQLCDLGLPRGPARAVAHVGVELLLDGWLSTDDSGVQAYHAALAITPHLPDLRRAADPLALERLSSRLQQAPIPHGYSEPRFVAERLSHMLQHRPRLRMPREALPQVIHALNDVQSALTTMAAPLLTHVRSATSDGRGPIGTGPSAEGAAGCSHVDAPRCPD